MEMNKRFYSMRIVSKRQILDHFDFCPAGGGPIGPNVVHMLVS